MILHKQSDTDRAIIFYMISSTDKTTGITGLSPTVTLSKNGGTFAACTGTVAEISGGVYKLTPSAADVGTLGITVLRATGTGADTYEREIQVVAITPYIAPGAHGGLIVLGANDMQGNSLEFNCNVNFVGGLTADTITAARYIAANVDTTPGYLAMTATNANAALPSAIWNALTSGLTTAGSAGKLLEDNLDAKVSEAGGGGGDATAANQTLILTQVNKITTGRTQYISHVHGQDITLNQGETYSSTLNPLTITFASGDSWPTDLTGYTITLIATQTEDEDGNPPATPATISQAGSVVVATGDTRAVRVDFTAAQSALLTPGLYDYYVKASTGSGGSTVDRMRQGQLRVIAD